MKSYLETKINECSNLINWLIDEVALYKNGRHAKLAQAIYDLLEIEKLRLEKAKRIHSLGDAFSGKVLIELHLIEGNILAVSNFYIPGLKKEISEEVRVGKMLMQNLNGCGVPFIEDILVRLEQDHAIWPGFAAYPVLFAPIQQTKTIVGTAAIFHEFGHVVYKKNSDSIENVIETTVSNYYLNMKREIGVASQTKREAQEGTINKAIAYWTKERINELFSDIYATYVCGPAYYYCWMDLSIKLGLDSFAIDLLDPHPPSSGRIKACCFTLKETQNVTSMVTRITEIWQKYGNSGTRNQDYDLYCHDKLIENIVKNVIKWIENGKLGIECYALNSINADTSECNGSKELITLLNEGIEILLFDPTKYDSWEKEALWKLYS